MRQRHIGGLERLPPLCKLVRQADPPAEAGDTGLVRAAAAAAAHVLEHQLVALRLLAPHLPVAADTPLPSARLPPCTLR